MASPLIIVPKITTPLRMYAILPRRMTNGRMAFFSYYYAARILEYGWPYFQGEKAEKELPNKPIVEFLDLEELRSYFYAETLLANFPIPDQEFLDAAFASMDKLMEYAWAKRVLGFIKEDPDAKEEDQPPT